MANILIEETTLKSIANAIRNVNGKTNTYFPIEMVDAINEILDDATYILVDENGNEAVGVVVGNETIFDATANDIREGVTAATAEGVTVGTKVIPSYHTTEAVRLIPNGSKFTIPLPDLDKYSYTKLQAIICQYNTSTAKSVAALKISILDKVYDVGSTVELSAVTKDAETKSINLGLINDTGKPCVIRFFTYKEIY